MSNTMNNHLFLTFAALLAAKVNAGSVPVERVTPVDVLNPDRGIYKHIETNVSQYIPLDLLELKNLRDHESISLIFRLYILDSFTNKDITENFLIKIGNDLNVIKKASMKVILRFCYSLSSNKDANQTQAVRHIRQLDRIFKDNALVISVVQAGFIGIYGEWDDTKNRNNSPKCIYRSKICTRRT